MRWNITIESMDGFGGCDSAEMVIEILGEVPRGFSLLASRYIGSPRVDDPKRDEAPTLAPRLGLLALRLSALPPLSHANHDALSTLSPREEVCDTASCARVVLFFIVTIA